MRSNEENTTKVTISFLLVCFSCQQLLYIQWFLDAEHSEAVGSFAEIRRKLRLLSYRNMIFWSKEKLRFVIIGNFIYNYLYKG